MYIQNIFIKNMGAIESLQITSDKLISPNGDPRPIVLVGQNGSGKTTLLSSIVDALYELSNNSFDDILPKNGMGYKYFKISGGKNIRLGCTYAFSYINFKKNEKIYEYLDLSGELTVDECKIKTNNLLNLRNSNGQDKNKKISSETNGDTEFLQDFSSNSYCYFPSDRYELPYWINSETIGSMEQFKDISKFNSNLGRDITIRRSLSEIKEWILDVFLDTRADLVFKEDGNASTPVPLSTLQVLQKTIKNIEKIISSIVQKSVSINLNYRNHSLSRIKLLEKDTGRVFIPSLDNLSAGQSTLLGIFINIIMYSDRGDLNKSINLKDIEGIVVIDEIDLHLHIELQNKILPELIKLFPKVQFIITTHSPFLLAGLSKVFKHDECIFINMPTGNVIESADDFEEFSKAYKLFNNITNTYKDELLILKSKISQSQKPLIITEGKTDWKHLKKALAVLSTDYPALDIDFLEFNDELKMGSSALQTMLECIKNLPQDRKIIGIFDRDEDTILKKFGTSSYQNLGNNVYALCIPKISDELDKISIEYYYKEEDLKISDIHGRRLFEGREFSESTISLCRKYIAKERNKVKKQVIIDSLVYSIADIDCDNSLALSKNNFSENIYNSEENFDDIDFKNFKLIFDIVDEIIRN